MPTMAWPRERKSARVTERGRESDPRRGWKSINGKRKRERESETGRTGAGRQERARKREYQEAEAAA